MNAAATANPTSSLWTHTAEAAVETPALDGSSTADVVVIGGGFTGLSTALHLAEKGVDVVVLETESPGFGASGRNNGQVIPAYGRHSPDQIVAEYGNERGERLNDWVAGSADLVFSLIEKHAIQCEAAQNGWLQPAHRASRMAGVRAKQGQWAARGQPARLLTGEETEGLTGSPYYRHGGWIHDSGGHIQPLGYSRGLARAAISAGATIHGKSPVTALDRAEGQWRATTPRGAVTADTVILATNGYTGSLWPRLRQSIVPFRTFHAATAPMSDNVAKSVLPENHGISDTRQALWAFRKDQGNRLITTAAPISPLGAKGKIEATTKARLEEAFPQIGEIEIAHIWEGMIAMTPERLPRLHELAGGVFAGLGYSGRGIALATAMGAALAERATGAPADAVAPLPVPIKTLPMHDIVAPLSRAMIGYYRWKDGRD
jgi:glycine/D-amino acid oxidase-like deaminating enzyme